MSNKLHRMVILFLFFSSLPIIIIASEATSETTTVTLPQTVPHAECSSPRRPREVHSWVGQAHHQLKKRENPFAYATDGGHLEILGYLQAAGELKQFYVDANFLSQLRRSIGRSTTAGTEILENIDTRNSEKLKKLLEKNKHGLPQYLISAINTFTTPSTNPHQVVTQKIAPPPTPDHSLFGQALGFLAKQWDPGEYVFKPDAKELAAYLTQTSQSSHCSDQNFKVNVERALKRMGYVHDYLRDRIAERNTLSAQEALNHNQAFLPVAHIALFQKAIDELKQEESIGYIKRPPDQSPSASPPMNDNLNDEEFEEARIHIAASPTPSQAESEVSPTAAPTPPRITDNAEQADNTRPAPTPKPTQQQKSSKKKKHRKPSTSDSGTGLP